MVNKGAGFVSSKFDLCSHMLIVACLQERFTEARTVTRLDRIHALINKLRHECFIASIWSTTSRWLVVIILQRYVQRTIHYNIFTSEIVLKFYVALWYSHFTRRSVDIFFELYMGALAPEADISGRDK